MRGHMTTGVTEVTTTLDGRLLVRQGHNCLELVSPSHTAWLLETLRQHGAEQCAILGEPLPFDEPPCAHIGA